MNIERLSNDNTMAQIVKTNFDIGEIVYIKARIKGIHVGEGVYWYEIDPLNCEPTEGVNCFGAYSIDESELKKIYKS